MFTHAIVRRPGRSLSEGITSAPELGKPIYEKALEQHDAYVAALSACGLEVTVLPALEEFPDSCFVEDTAVVTRCGAIVDNPGAPSRNGEAAAMEPTLREFFSDDRIAHIEAPGTLEGGDVMMVDAVAAEECEVLFVNISAFSGGAPGTVHEKLLRNLLTVSMRKNLSLSQRIFCTTPKTVRGRLLTYFSAQAARSGSLQFEIPFNRQQLADYLNLDRSALSKELCKMRDEGLLTFEKNRFALNELPE